MSGAPSGGALNPGVLVLLAAAHLQSLICHPLPGQVAQDAIVLVEQLLAALGIPQKLPQVAVIGSRIQSLNSLAIQTITDTQACEVGWSSLLTWQQRHHNRPSLVH